MGVDTPITVLRGVGEATSVSWAGVQIPRAIQGGVVDEDVAGGSGVGVTKLSGVGVDPPWPWTVA